MFTREVMAAIALNTKVQALADLHRMRWCDVCHERRVTRFRGGSDACCDREECRAELERWAGGGGTERDLGQAAEVRFLEGVVARDGWPELEQQPIVERPMAPSVWPIEPGKDPSSIDVSKPPPPIRRG